MRSPLALRDGRFFTRGIVYEALSNATQLDVCQGQGPPPNLTDISLICSRGRRNARSAALLEGTSFKVYSWWVRTYFGQIFPGVEYWQVLRAKFFLIQKTWEISNKETHKEVLQFNKQKNTKSSLLYGWIALWCDPNSSVCVRIYLIFQEFTTCLLVKYTIKFLKHTNIFAM